MHPKLLYIILLITAARLVSACSSHDPADITSDSEMAFVVSDDQSRAAVVSSLNSAGSEFAIYGDMKFKDNPKLIVFDNAIVRYNNGNWVYDEPQYWFPQHEHSFVAMLPAAAEGLTGTGYSDSKLSFKYTLPADYTAASDLMVATHRRLYQTNTSSVVALKFSHIMSRIDFKVKNDKAADIVRVTRIALEGVNKTGAFAITPAPLTSGQQTDDYNTTSWTDLTDKGPLVADISIDIPENQTRPLFPDDNALFIIPQPDNNAVILHITYTLIDAGANDEQLTLTAQAPIGGWQQGKVYTYSLDIEEITKEINLTVSVKPWHPQNNTNVAVPEY